LAAKKRVVRRRAMLGTIVSFDALDAVGWLELEDGNAACFEKAACLDVEPAAATRVYVSALRSSVGGLMIAERVEPYMETLEPTRPMSESRRAVLVSMTAGDEAAG
jgi:hypothetical protein